MAVRAARINFLLKEAASVRGFSRGLDTLAYALPANAMRAVTALPRRMLKNKAEAMAIGRRIKRGPMAGKRLQAMSGGPGKGMTPITASEFRAIRAAPAGNPEVFASRIGGKKYHFKRKYMPGGAAGLAMKHPLLTAALAGGGYMALRNKDSIGPASQAAVLREMAMHQGLQQRISSPVSFENPLAGETWK